jgi:hypothetical protein
MRPLAFRMERKSYATRGATTGAAFAGSDVE